MKFTEAHKQLPQALAAIVGTEHVLAGGSASQYTIGARVGKGEALAVCRPGTLEEAVAVLRVCVAADVAVIPQGRNTGLTGGSVPRDTLCDRPTVVISNTRLESIHAVAGSTSSQVLCLAGAGIQDLSVRAASMGRESHSVLGSIFLNPTVAAGVALGSGGTQVRKGPAYTERALWCRVNKDGQVEVVNTLGITAESEEALLRRVERGGLTAADFTDKSSCALPASAAGAYSRDVCTLDGLVSRFNADTTGIEPCRSEGKVMILATLHDTFPLPSLRKSFWISFESLEAAQAFKREVLLQSAEDLPISCEYIDRDCFDVVDTAGRVLCLAIEKLGLGENLSKLWGVKLFVESLPLPFFDNLPDRVLYYLNNICPQTLPAEIHDMGKRYDHHLLVTIGEYGSGNMERTEKMLESFVRSHNSVVVHTCKPDDIGKVTFFRFAAAPAFKTWCVGNGVQGVSIDYALPKNDPHSPDFKALTGIAEPLKRMRYAHLGCNVVHEDIAFQQGVDIDARKMQMKKEVEARGGKLPAEHGHGTEYAAPESTQQRWRKMDPRNVLNPGVGGLSYSKGYSQDAE